MLKRSKAISIVLAFVFCMTFLAPALIAPAVAEASTTYEVLKAPAVTTGSDPVDLGVVKVTLPDTALFAYSTVTVSLPSDLSFATGDADVDVEASATGAGIEIVASGAGDALATTAFNAASFAIGSNNNFDIQLSNNLPAGADKYFYIYFNDVNLNHTTGDIAVDFTAPANSGFSSSADMVIAKSSTSGSTTTTIKKVNDITEAVGDIDSITIMEDTPGTLNLSGTVTLEILTKGFSWKDVSSDKAEYGWAFAGEADEDIAANSDEQKVTVDLSAAAKSTAGKISLTGLEIAVNEDKASAGDEVEVKISGADMDKVYLIVAKYVDYEVVVEDGTSEELVAGQADQGIGEFWVKEGAAGSLVDNRTIKLTLPEGVKWTTEGTAEVMNSSNIVTSVGSISGDDNEIIKVSITDPSDNEGAELKFKDFEVEVSPDFTGDIEVEVSGSAGAEGTVKVAEVVPAATIAVDDAADIILGKPDQKLSDITITEGAVESLLEGDIVLDLDDGYRFVGTPKAEVVEGDIDIDSDVDVTNNTLTITVDDQSDKTASKIVISDIYVDAFRTAPEGPVEIEFNKFSTALNETSFDESAGKAVIANCVTAAEGETLDNGQFVITSNIYEINGVKKVMDVAPYIKGDRTYVPVRYLAYVLGVSEDDVVWDAASQKVTLTEGETVVELTIGSTTMYVNGEAVTMDVAPEISSDRTMLPARFVAEGFGAKVGWDPATRTVLISK